MNTFALIYGIIFFIRAILDGCGVETYRIRSEIEDVKEWQKTRAFINVFLGISAIIIYYSSYGPKIQYYIGCGLLLIGEIILYIWNRKVKL